MPGKISAAGDGKIHGPILPISDKSCITASSEDWINSSQGTRPRQSPIRYSPTLAVKARSRASALRNSHSGRLRFTEHLTQAFLHPRAMPWRSQKGEVPGIISTWGDVTKPSKDQWLCRAHVCWRRKRNRNWASELDRSDFWKPSHCQAPHVRILPGLQQGFAKESCTLLACSLHFQSTLPIIICIYKFVSCLMPSLFPCPQNVAFHCFMSRFARKEERSFYTWCTQSTFIGTVVL